MTLALFRWMSEERPLPPDLAERAQLLELCQFWQCAPAEALAQDREHWDDALCYLEARAVARRRAEQRAAAGRS